MRAWTNSIRELARKISDLVGNVSDDELILTVEYVVNRLINEEDRLRKEGNEESLVLSARNAKQKTPRSQITCWKCKKKEHYS